MDKIDKTKENLRLDNMDANKRKELFNKFVDGGGEVQNNRERRRALILDRDQQKQNLQKIETHKNKSSKNNIRKVSSSKKNISVKNEIKKEKQLSFFELLKLRITLKFFRVAKLDGLYFNDNFFLKFNSKFKPALLNIQTVYLNLFKKNLSNSKRIIERLDKDNLIFFEIIEKISNIYDKSNIDHILENHTNFPEIKQKLSELKEPLGKIFREMYLLTGYENTTYLAFEKAVAIDSKLSESGNSYDLKEIKKSLYILFHNLYPKLFYLFCYYEGEIFENIDSNLDEILEIKISEKIGNRVRGSDPIRKGSSSQNNSQKKDSTKKNENKEVVEREKPIAIRKGLKLMYRLDIINLRKKYDKKFIFENVGDANKTLITYLLFKEFDTEYSFILTTNKIKYEKNDALVDRIDYKDKLNKYYDEMRSCVLLLTDYSELNTKYENIRLERPKGRNQYVQYVKRLEETKKKMEEVDRVSRGKVKIFMYNVATAMKELIKDFNDKQQYITNPQDILTFSSQVEGKMKLEGKKIFEAIVIIYYFTIAFTDRLSVGGDLFGKNELDKTLVEENKDAEENVIKEKPQDETSLINDLDDSIDFSSENIDKPLIDELDDFL